ncbi:uncharacterized protein FIBRA_07241 [Fibroporia radiculosa]|uniref:JmjC domain-containing protein n=1 Tax=Fibroporia radiculosa TaxID=599839 RepID=J4H4I2_9APHY|nr:uncharacterized protein FIBRA_07241 [Fibroporia radiculosa]CCM05039.1 predicted protein [Fibroporia radiculosa]
MAASVAPPSLLAVSLHTLQHDLASNIPEIQSCPGEPAGTLQHAVTKLTDGELPLDEDTCLGLEHVINLAYDKMASSPRQSSTSWRRLYTDACILRSLADIRSLLLTEDVQLARSCIARLDHAIVIAGAPGECRLDLIHILITQVQCRCLGFQVVTSSSHMVQPVFNSTMPEEQLLPIVESASESVPRLQAPPSLTAFISQYSRHPFIIPAFISDWPAMTQHPWESPAYLRSVSGPGRVVPIEVGSDYRNDDWTQQMMSWDNFLDALQPNRSQKGQPILYLAQHNLLTQFPQLRDDIVVPDYVYASLSAPDDYPQYCPPGNDDELIINAWLGPAGAVSPAHTDPFYNFYAQVVGRKTVWLAPPDASPSMYPYPPPSSTAHDSPHNPAANNTSPSMSNTSQVDVFQSRAGAEETRPMFWSDAVPRALAVTLEPGDLLFFPPGWWHAMRSEETSFSVSMWF